MSSSANSSLIVWVEFDSSGLIMSDIISMSVQHWSLLIMLIYLSLFSFLYYLEWLSSNLNVKSLIFYVRLVSSDYFSDNI